jgi:hypothetical protein
MAKLPTKSIKQTIEELAQRVRLLEKADPENHAKLMHMQQHWMEVSQLRLQHESENTDLEIRWTCLWAIIGEAIRHERVINQCVVQYNESVLLFEAMKKDKAELVSSISSLNDTCDALTFELKQVRKERDDAVARSQRQASTLQHKVVQLEEIKKLLK